MPGKGDDKTHLRLVEEWIVAGKTRRRDYGSGMVYLRGKTWWISFYLPDGERIWKSAKTKDKELAEHLLREELVAIGRGETEALKPWKFEESALEWQHEELENSGRYRERTINYWRGIVHNHLLPVFGSDTELHYLQENPALLLNYINAKLTGKNPKKGGKPLPVRGKAQNKLATETVLAHITVLGMIFNYARNRNRMTSNKDPMRLVKDRKNKPKRNSRETVKALETEQTVEIQKQITKAEDKRLNQLMLHLGLRIGEGIGLYVSDWNPKTLELKVLRTARVDDKGRVYLDQIQDATKTEAGQRTLKVEVVVAEWIDAQIKEMRSQGRIPAKGDGFIFPSKRGTVKNPNNWRNRVWTPALEDAEVWIEGMPLSKKPTPHWLRHTYASRLIKDGVDPATIAHLMGHAGPDITLRIYSHIFEEQKSVIADTTRLYSPEELAA